MEIQNTECKKWLDATVPGCNYCDLMDNKIIEDPFYGLNEYKYKNIALKDWEYLKDFTINEEQLKSDRIFLVCKMLDTICDIYINSVLIGHGENCFFNINLM